MGDITERDLEHLRHAIRLSDLARIHGNQPFGAVLVASDGKVLAAAENSMLSDCDLTSHAEMNALRIASKVAPAGEIAQATMYASGEPCPMCSGAMLQNRIRRIVFGIRFEVNRSYHVPSQPGDARPTVTCGDIMRFASPPMEVIGPLLEEEARVPFELYATRGKK